VLPVASANILSFVRTVTALTRLGILIWRGFFTTCLSALHYIPFQCLRPLKVTFRRRGSRSRETNCAIRRAYSNVIGSPNTQTCKIWSDAPSGEDTAGGIRAICGGACEAAGEETRHVRLHRFYAHLLTQPKREVHGAGANDEEPSPTGPDGRSRMVPETPPCACGPAAEDPQR